MLLYSDKDKVESCYPDAPRDRFGYRKDMSFDDKHREDRARHMINPEHAHQIEQQRSDDMFNHSLKRDPYSINSSPPNDHY